MLFVLIYIQALAVVDALQQFGAAVQSRKADASKMEHSLACLMSYEIETPLAFNVLFFQEKSVELVSFLGVTSTSSILSVRVASGETCQPSTLWTVNQLSLT